MKTARPYRSHRYPACVRCHRLRVRCVIEVPRHACSRCHRQGAACSLASADGAHATPKIGFVHRSLLADDQSLDYRARVIGPVVARDTYMLDQYILRGNSQSAGIQAEPIVNEEHSHRPIYHVPLPPRIPSPLSCQCSRDLVQQLLIQVEPYLDTLILGYFEYLAPCYPLTDEGYIMARLKNRNAIPETLLVLLVVYALFYWDFFPMPSAYDRPNQNFACSVAVTSIAISIHKSDLATISAICLAISGRPCRRLIHNAANVARAVALAHTIGLNHDCSEWKIRDTEKRMRWQVWWAVLIMDRWFNFAQGTPTYIAKNQYDVPLPTGDILLTNSMHSVEHSRAAKVYIQLCRLTEILGDILPLIYQIRNGTNDFKAAEQVNHFSVDLNLWRDSQPGWMNVDSFHERPAVPGLANLQLSYLSVRMLLRRIAWHETIRNQKDTGLASSLLSRCQTAAEDIVRFVNSLQKHDLKAFWFPYNAHHFTSAVTLLLCCALQTSDSNTRTQCMTSARTLVYCLRRHQEEHEWDLAELCLVQSEAVLRRIDDAFPQMRVAIPAASAVEQPPMPNCDIEAGHEFVDSIGNENTLGDVLTNQNGNPTNLEVLFPEVFGDWFNDYFDIAQDYPTFDD